MAITPKHSDNLDDLSSDRGVDYTRLRDFLKAENWAAADLETASLLIVHLARQAARGYIDEEDMKKIPSKDLQTIDKLWSKYSNGHFGFSIQKKIWHSTDKNTKKFAEKVLWHNRPWFFTLNNKTTPNIFFTKFWFLALSYTLDSPLGHLPALVWQKRLSNNRNPFKVAEILDTYISSLFSRQDIF